MHRNNLNSLSATLHVAVETSKTALFSLKYHAFQPQIQTVILLDYYLRYCCLSQQKIPGSVKKWKVPGNKAHILLGRPLNLFLCVQKKKHTVISRGEGKIPL